MSGPANNCRTAVGFCTYNRSARLPALISALRAQACDEPFDLLVVDNNSADDTAEVLRLLAEAPGVRLHHVRETEQGIVPARNRLLHEAQDYEFLLMMDDDEMPAPGWVQAGLRALRDEGLECVGGRVCVRFEHGRPRWLGDDLLGFLCEVDHGTEARPITDDSTPIWTANVGYRMALFATGLRFDMRYSRVGNGLGGGEDVVMFESLLERGHRLGYRPEMVVEHFVEAWRLRRMYFLRLHFTSGVRAGLHATPPSSRQAFGAPLYLYPQALRQGLRALGHLASGSSWLRHAMTFTYACGRIVGARRKTRTPAGARA